jgi:predicted MPP superfamily phosphohydrolase
VNIISVQIKKIFSDLAWFRVAPFLSFFLFSVSLSDAEKLYFISDTQAPLFPEKILYHAYKNEQARDSLFADIIRQKPGVLLLLGDLTAMGSKNKKWAPLDTFLNALHSLATKVYAIPGNHEYMFRPSIGMREYTKRFPEQSLSGFYVTTDSMAVIMFNSNFKNLKQKEISDQLSWYRKTMDSLESHPMIKTIIVCTHQAPFSNSAVVGSDEEVADSIVPQFGKCKKARLFISGHSHNLEYFADSAGKHFLVGGGGGGIAQPLVPLKKRLYHDLISPEEKPLYFYLIVERKGSILKLVARGFKRDFSWFELNFGEITLE